MQKGIESLKNKFFEIRKMGYVKSSRRGSTGIGKTFEDLLGKEEDTLSLPDYNGIEIKTKRGYSKSYITLFNATIFGNEESQIKRLKETYGYPDKIDKELKVLYCSFFSNRATLVANRYFFKLKVDYEREKIFLIIYDKYFNILEDELYWRFEVLKEKLEKKLQYLALVKGWPNVIKGETYYRYYDLKIYRLRSFERFLKLIDEGRIRVNFKIGTFRTGERRGEVDNHGTGFQIKEESLEELFIRIY